MALLGSLQDLFAQVEKKPLLREGLEYLLNTDLESVFASMAPDTKQKVEINGTKVFAIYQEYTSKDGEPKFEGHIKYIDIQYIHKGEELMLVAGKNKIVEDDAYNADKDIYLPKVEEYSTLRLDAGLGCILYPEDLHSPGNCLNAPATVRKIVVKVEVE